MNLRHRLILLSFAGLLASCQLPVYDPPIPVPTPPAPVDPGPVDPVTNGAITVAQFDAVPAGATEAEVLAALGTPFRRFTAAGMDVLQYVFNGSSAEAHFFLKDGKVERKARFG